MKRATRSAACRASHSSLRASACIDHLALGVDAVAEVGDFGVAFGHEVNRDERFQAFLQREVGISILGRRKCIELDKEIEIATSSRCCSITYVMVRSSSRRTGGMLSLCIIVY